MSYEARSPIDKCRGVAIVVGGYLIRKRASETRSAFGGPLYRKFNSTGITKNTTYRFNKLYLYGTNG